MTGALAAASAAALLALAAAGCGGGGSDDATSTEAPATSTQPKAAGGIGLEKIGDFDSPLYVTQPPGSNDLYVVEREGRVKIVRDGKTLGEPFINISNQVSTEVEQGL